MAYETPITIKKAIENIRKRYYVLPSIQREFVWDTEQIERLFDSIMRDYPISTFLFWKVDKNRIKNFQFYEFLKNYHEKDARHNNKADLSTDEDVIAILDGQQRMTSMYIALTGTYAKKMPYFRWDSPYAFPKKKLYLNLLSKSDNIEVEYDFKFLTKEEAEAYDKAKLLDDDVEGTREERAFRMWINSLGIDDVYINNLYEDVRSGVLLLKVIDRIKPGVVNWKKVDLNPKNNFAKLVNCNEAVDASKKIPVNIVGIAGPDINRPEKKLILAIVWQLMRESTLHILGDKSENDILEWANSRVKVDSPYKSFSDKRLSDSLFFIEIMASVEPRAINWDIVKKGNFIFYL